jgi:hypothetical protein
MWNENLRQRFFEFATEKVLARGDDARGVTRHSSLVTRRRSEARAVIPLHARQTRGAAHEDK